MAREVIVYADAETVAQATGARLLLAIGDALALRGRADIVLTGGTVGIALLRKAAALELAQAIDWTGVHMWWGDERFVPAGHADRNEGQAQEALLGTIALPEENIHRVQGAAEGSSVEDAAAAYASDIAAAGGPAWDVAMFGMGPDGHVASLFPGHPVYTNPADAAAVAVRNSPKPPAERVSLSLAAINRAREVWIVAAGAEKAQAVAHALHGTGDLPAAAVHGTERTLWLLDAAAATQV